MTKKQSQKTISSKTHKKTIYRNLHIFVNRIQNFIQTFKTKIIKNNFFRCLKKKSFNLTHFVVVKHKKIVYYEQRHRRMNQNVNNRISKTINQNYKIVFYKKIHND